MNDRLVQVKNHVQENKYKYYAGVFTVLVIVGVGVASYIDGRKDGFLDGYVDGYSDGPEDGYEHGYEYRDSLPMTSSEWAFGGHSLKRGYENSQELLGL